MEAHYNPPCGAIKKSCEGDLNLERIDTHICSESSIQNTLCSLNHSPPWLRGSILCAGGGPLKL